MGRPMTSDPNPENQSMASIDKLVHEPARLMILSQLYVIESIDFIFLMRQTGLTQGNLSAHLNKLETAGYVKITKKFIGKRPHTLLSLTKRGKSVFKTYVKSMKQIFDGLID